MIHQEEITCPHCQSNDLVKNSMSENGAQKWQYNKCRKHFRREYRYNACKVGIREKIIEIISTGSDVQDIGKVLKISKDTVCSVLKRNAKNEPSLSELVRN
jgi:transposase-like protein